MSKPRAPADELLRRPLYLYDLPPEVLDTLVLKSDAPDVPAPDTPSDRPQTPSSETSESSVGSQSCSLCGLSFATFLDQRGHLKSDLHHYNLKQKLRGAKPVGEDEFEKLIGNLDESLSGSDSSESDDEEDNVTGRKDNTLTTLLKKQATLADKSRKSGGAQDDEEEDVFNKKKRGSGKPPLMWFSSSLLPADTYFGVYRAVFTSPELAKEDTILEAVRSRQLAPISMPKQPKDGPPMPLTYSGRHIFMCMIGGGHFAAMVVSLAPRKSKHHGPGPMNREATVLAHKTFHRYTTRRKQGGAQSANDAAKGAAHSAGAGLRRYNEQALVEDVRNLLRDWKGLLDSSDLLFIRATGTTNRRTLFGPYDGQVLKSNDPRIRGFPFSTRRATQNELMRSFIELTRLKVREIVPQPEAPPEATTTPTKPKPAAAPKLTEEEETALLHTSQTTSLIRRSKVPALLTYLKSNNLSLPDFRFYPIEAHHHAPTPLHLAASQNSAPLVTGLLVRGGADPTLPNGEGRMAFDLAGDRATRDAFRVARDELGEDKWDWESAHVPTAMKKAEADKREERERAEAEKKEKERRHKEEKRLEKEPVKMPERQVRKGGVLGGAPLMTAEERRREEARGLTPEQKMRLEREKRARAAEERMRRLQGGG